MTGVPFDYAKELDRQSGVTNSTDHPVSTLDAEQQQTREGVDQAAYVASKRTDPERWAKVVEMARKNRLPTDVVDRNFTEFLGSETARKNRGFYDQVLEETPGLARWLTDPDNATISKDEVPHLMAVERGIRAVSEGKDLPPYRFGPFGMPHPFAPAMLAGYSDLKSSVGLLAAAYGMVSPETAAAEISGARKSARLMREAAPDYVKEYGEAMTRHRGDIEAATKFFSEANVARRQGNILEALKGYATGTIATAGETLDMIGAAILRPRGWAYSQIEGLVGMLPALAAGQTGALAGAAVGSAGAGVGAVPGAVVGGAIGLGAGTFVGMAPVSIGQALGTELEKRGVNLEDPEALRAALSDSSTLPHLRYLAEQRGVTSALVASVVAALGGKIAGAAEGAPLATRMAAHVAEAGGQAAGMAAAGAAGAAAAGEKVNVGETVQSGVEMLGYGAAMETAGALRRTAFHPEPTRAAEQVAGEAQRALHAERDNQALAEVGAAVKEMKATPQAPERMRSLIEMVTGGDPNARVFFQTDAWDKYWNGKGLSPAKAASDILNDGGQAYYAARNANSTLSMPLSDYIAKVAPSEHFEGLLGETRTAADGPTLKEAREYMQGVPKLLHEIAQEAQAGATGDVSDVHAEMVKRLREAGVPEPQVRPLAQLVNSMFEAPASRAGQTPEALFERFGPKVERGSGEEEPERLRAAAIRYRDGQIFEGPTHGEAYLESNKHRPTEEETPDEGYTTSRGRYIDRDEALRFASPEQVEMADGEPLHVGNAPIEKAPTGIFKQSAEEGLKGKIRFGDRDVRVSLFEKADKSTFIHEMGHLGVEMLSTLAKESGNPDMVADYTDLAKWAGAKGVPGEKLEVEHHERIARGFEAYVMEGKAPSDALRGVFFRMKQWLLGVYKTLTGLNVNLTPEVRKVFDRMLATDEQLADAERTAEVAPMMPEPEKAGMNPESVDRYRKAVQDAHQAAEEQLTEQHLKELRREESRDWKAKRDPIEAEVTKQIDESPLYRALTALRDKDQPLKLNKDAIIASYGKEAYDRLPKGITGQSGAKDVSNPNIIAEMFGFDTGRALVEALAQAPKREDAIRTLTDSRMREEHGERTTPEDLEAAAQAAVRGTDERMRLLRMEAEHLASDNFAAFKGLTRAMVRRVLPADQVRAEAQRTLDASMTADVRQSLVRQFDLAARRHGADARELFLKGDFDGALQSKQREILSTALFDAASRGRDAVSEALDEFKAVFGSDERLSKTRDMDLIGAARSILAEFGIGTSKESAQSHLDKLEQYDQPMYEAVRAIMDEHALPERANWRNLTYGDFRILREAVGSLWELSSRSQQIEVDGKLMLRKDAVADLNGTVEGLLPKEEKAGYVRTKGKWDKLSVALTGAEAHLRRAEFFADAMDSGKPDGFFRRYIINPIFKNATVLRMETLRRYKEYEKVVEPMRGRMTHEETPAPELTNEEGRPFMFRDRQQLLNAILNSGNDSNLGKLVRGGGWGKRDPESGIIDRSKWDKFFERATKDGTITKEDMDYAQGVWNLHEAMKPGAQRAFKAIFGRFFSEVTSKPIQTPWGEYKGGYVPIRYDILESPDAAIRQERARLLEGHADMFPSQITTGRGFTYSRAESYAAPLALDGDMVPGHIDAVLRFTHLEPAVRDVTRLLTDRTFRAQLDAFDPVVGKELLAPWLERAAQQRTETAGRNRTMDTIWRWLRNNTGVQVLGGNLVTPLVMLTHFPAAVIKTRGYLGGAVWRWMSGPRDYAKGITERSDFMNTRVTGGVMEIEKNLTNIMLDPSVWKSGRAFIREHGMFLMRAVQHSADLVTWGGAYDRASAEGVSEAEAIDRADSAVRMVQGGFTPEELSRWETSTPFLKALSTFYSFFNAKYNLLRTETSIAQQVGLKKGAGRLTIAYLFGLMIPAVMAGIARQQASGEPFDKDGDGPTDDAFKLFFGSQWEMMTRMVPVVGPVGQATVDMFIKKKDSSDEITGAPVIKQIEAGVRAPADIAKAMKEGWTAREVKDVLSVLGMATGLPLQTVGKAVGYRQDVKTGKAQPRNAVDYFRGLVSGQTGAKR